MTTTYNLNISTNTDDAGSNKGLSQNTNVRTDDPNDMIDLLKKLSGVGSMTSAEPTPSCGCHASAEEHLEEELANAPKTKTMADLLDLIDTGHTPVKDVTNPRPGDNPLVDLQETEKEKTANALAEELTKQWQSFKLSEIAKEFDTTLAEQAIEQGLDSYVSGSNEFAVRTQGNLVKVFPILEDRVMTQVPLYVVENNDDDPVTGRDLNDRMIQEIDGYARKYQKYYPRQLVDELINKAVEMEPYGKNTGDPKAASFNPYNYSLTITIKVLEELKNFERKHEMIDWNEPPYYEAKPGIVPDGEIGTLKDGRLYHKRKGYISETGNSVDAVKSAIVRRIQGQHVDLLKKYGVERVMDAVDNAAYHFGSDPLDEIGSSDVTVYVKYVMSELGEPVTESELEEKEVSELEEWSKEVTESYLADETELDETTGVTDYDPPSQGGSRKKLLAILAQSGSPEDAEAARRAGATQDEIRAAMEEAATQVDEDIFDLFGKMKKGYDKSSGDESPLLTKLRGAVNRSVIRQRNDGTHKWETEFPVDEPDLIKFNYHKELEESGEFLPPISELSNEDLANYIEKPVEWVEQNREQAEEMASEQSHRVADVNEQSSGTLDSVIEALNKMIDESDNEDMEEAKNPYAVGMAKAMELTGDEPPLEKSTIKKAHKIARAVEKTNEAFPADPKSPESDRPAHLRKKERDEQSPLKPWMTGDPNVPAATRKAKQGDEEVKEGALDDAFPDLSKAATGLQNLGGKKVDPNSLEVELGPDPYLVSATWMDGTPLTDEELDQLQQDHPEMVRQAVLHKSMSKLDEENKQVDEDLNYIKMLLNKWR